jgi:4-oxalocrotonate tautomerase
MPFVSVKVIEGVLSPAQKREVIKGVTDTLVTVKGEGLRQAIVVVIEEVKSGEWAIGGRMLTTADVEVLVARPIKKRRPRVRSAA